MGTVPGAPDGKQVGAGGAPSWPHCSGATAGARGAGGRICLKGPGWNPCAVWTQWWRAPKGRDIGPGGRVRLPLALAVLSGFISSCPPRAPTVTPAPASSCHPPSPRPPSALSCVSLPVSQAAINPAGPGLLQGSWAPAGGAGPPARRPCPAQAGPFHLLLLCRQSLPWELLPWDPLRSLHFLNTEPEPSPGAGGGLWPPPAPPPQEAAQSSEQMDLLSGGSTARAPRAPTVRCVAPAASPSSTSLPSLGVLLPGELSGDSSSS